jgi:hypothetical protein
MSTYTRDNGPAIRGGLGGLYALGMAASLLLLAVAPRPAGFFIGEVFLRLADRLERGSELPPEPGP